MVAWVVTGSTRTTASAAPSAPTPVSVEAQDEQPGVQYTEEPVEQPGHDGHEEHHPGVGDGRGVEDPEDA